jgi:hypothetical protein
MKSWRCIALITKPSAAWPVPSTSSVSLNASSAAPRCPLADRNGESDNPTANPPIYSAAPLRKSSTKQFDFIDPAAVQHTFNVDLTGQNRLTGV